MKYLNFLFYAHLILIIQSQKLKEEQSSSGHSPNGRKHRGAKVTLKTASVTLCTFDGSPEENGEQQQLGSSQSEDAEKESKQKCGGGNARRKSKSIPRKSVNTVGQLDSNRDCDSGEEGNLEEIDVSQYFSQPSSSHSSAPTALEVKEEIPRNVELHNLAPIRHPPITELINNDSQLTCLTRVSDYLTPLEGISYPMVDSYYPNFNEPLPENVWQDSDSNLDGSKNFPVWVGGQHGSIGAALTQAIGIIDDNYDAVLPL